MSINTWTEPVGIIQTGTEITAVRTGRKSVAEFDLAVICKPHGAEQYKFQVGTVEYTVPRDQVDVKEIEVGQISIKTVVDHRGNILRVSCDNEICLPQSGFNGDIAWTVLRKRSYGIALVQREVD